MRNETLYATHEFENGIVEIHFDTDPINPRKEFDHLGKMACWPRDYNLGDRHDYKSSRDLWQDLATDIHPDFPNPHEGIWDGVDEKLAEHQRKIIEKHFVVLPLYLCDHSGITMSTGAFSCPWDSGQAGWIYMPMTVAREAFEATSLTPDAEIRVKALECLRAEVKEYDDFLTGQIFGFKAFSINEVTGESEEIDSCWGLYGAEYALEEGKAQLPTLDVNREFDLAEAALA